MASRRPSTRENPKGPPATPISDPEENLRKSRALCNVLFCLSIEDQPANLCDSYRFEWVLTVKESAEEVIEEIFLEIPDVASFAALLVCLSEALALLRISYGSETGVAGGP